MSARQVKRQWCPTNPKKSEFANSTGRAPPSTACRHYEELWREGVSDLVGLLESEHPEDRAAAPKVRPSAPARLLPAAAHSVEGRTFTKRLHPTCRSWRTGRVCM